MCKMYLFLDGDDICVINNHEKERNKSFEVFSVRRLFESETTVWNY